MVFEHAGEKHFPRVQACCRKKGGMVVICAAPGGFNSLLTCAIVAMHQEALQGSHFAPPQAASAGEQTDDWSVVWTPACPKCFSWNDLPRSPHEDECATSNKPGNMSRTGAVSQNRPAHTEDALDAPQVALFLSYRVRPDAAKSPLEMRGIEFFGLSMQSYSLETGSPHFWGVRNAPNGVPFYYMLWLYYRMC